MYLLRACGVPGTVLDAENKAVNKTSDDAWLCGACLLGGRQAGKETDNSKTNMEETYCVIQVVLHVVRGERGPGVRIRDMLQF